MFLYRTLAVGDKQS